MMRSQFMKSSALLGIGLTFGLMNSGSGAKDPIDAPTAGAFMQKSATVAVIDLQRLISESPRTKFRREEHQKWVDQNQADLTKSEEDVKKAEGDLAVYNPGTPAHSEKADAVEMEKFRLNQKFKRLEAERERRAVLNHKENFDEILRIIEDYAKEKGIDTVLQKDSATLRGASQDQILLQMFSRSLLWSDDALDITDEVLNILGR